jgi:glucans biosynthesis protein C
MARPHTMSRSSLALSNLRAVVILIVIAFHAALTYVQFIPELPHSFNDPPFAWRAFPIVDSHRWIGFDLFCAWHDVYLMSLMFLLSGLFVRASLGRKQAWAFARDRFRRLGIPYVFGMLVLIPPAFYPTYLVLGGTPGVAEYWRHFLALPFWPNGQLWFLWQLLALSVFAAVLYRLSPRVFELLGKWSGIAGRRPVIYFAALVAISAVVYVPLALAFTPWGWSNSGILSVQWCRPLLYAVYFFAGVGIGAAGIDVGLVAADGELARRWKLWLAVGLGTPFLWMGVTSLTMDGPAPTVIQVAADLCFVLACAGGSFFLIATTLRFGTGRSAIFDNLSDNAYSLYLVHYPISIWLQYALLGAALFAFAKGFIVFCGSVLLSWLVVFAYGRAVFGIRVVMAPQDPVAGKMPPQSNGLYARLRQIVSQ